jgi:hypothetical protein
VDAAGLNVRHVLGLSRQRNTSGVMPATPSQAARSASSRLVGARGLGSGRTAVMAHPEPW